MTAELWVLAKVTVVLVLGLSVVRLSGRARASVRGAMLACTFGALLALPVAAAVAPAFTFDIPIRSSNATPARNDRAGAVSIAGARSTVPPAESIETTSRGPSESAATSARVGWSVGAAVLLLALMAALWRLRRMTADGLPWPAADALVRTLADERGVRPAVAVLLHEAVSAPVVSGLLRPTILLPLDAREWSDPDLRRTLVHELEHVRRGDWLLQLFARTMCAVYWFHPLVWMAWRRLRLECECACDDAVARASDDMTNDAERADYAEQLVMLAERMSRSRSHPALAMASRSDLSVRVAALLDRHQMRGRASAPAVIGMAAIGMAAVALMAPLRLVAVSRAPGVTTSDERPAGAQTGRGQAPRVDALAEALSSRLLEVAERGDVGRVTDLLNGGADANVTVSGDGTPLIVAAREGHAAVVRLLLDRGADPNLSVQGDGNPLIMAAREGHVEIVTLLLDRGAMIDEIVPEDENPLIQASAEGRLEVVKLLIARGANVNARAWSASSPRGTGGEWRTPLSVARRGGHDAVTRYLQSKGASE